MYEIFTRGLNGNFHAAAARSSHLATSSADLFTKCRQKCFERKRSLETGRRRSHDDVVSTRSRGASGSRNTVDRPDRTREDLERDRIPARERERERERRSRDALKQKKRSFSLRESSRDSAARDLRSGLESCLVDRSRAESSGVRSPTFLRARTMASRARESGVSRSVPVDNSGATPLAHTRRLERSM